MAVADTTSPATLTADPATLAAVSTVATTTPQPARSRNAGRVRAAKRAERGMSLSFQSCGAGPVCPDARRRARDQMAALKAVS